ncbi:hypothetical protein CLG85_024140 [Yangia mangrovi]|uniref:Uncharacterized protein n=1 Tax=Alloyangia mangrovi TaxID=1779329 RepID=A0ABT2KSS0_9RHOB|nr:hypothetical protein [Alloyangia mangrovi]MCT4373211.1 hypothetical protein [Alloyangia mangrovi]
MPLPAAAKGRARLSWHSRNAYMGFGDRVFMECRGRDHAPLFGAINQQVIYGGRT